jgi:hypothetical protein
MKQSKNVLQWQNGFGEPVPAGDFTVTPQSQALVVRWPFGVWVWNRPVAVVVEGRGELQRIPVVDVTRLVQLSLITISLACWIAFLFFGRQRKQDKIASPRKRTGRASNDQ